MKILVTGSSGTIGTQLCLDLLKKDFDVVGADRVKNKWEPSVNEITFNCNLVEENSLNNMEKDFDLVIHLAANAKVYDLVVEPKLALENFISLFNVLDFVRKSNKKKFIFASSREVYGNIGGQSFNEEETSVDFCESPYAASKIGGEALVRSYGACYNIDFIIVRFSNVYGKYDESDRVIPLFIRSTKNGKALTVFGKDKILDFTYIGDATGAIVNLIEKFDTAKGQTYNIAFGEGHSILSVAQLIQKYLGQTRIDIKDSRTGEVTKYIGNIDKLKKTIKFRPKVNLEEGIKKSIEWYENNHR